MWIDADPSRRVDGWLGHMANDAASCAAGAYEAQILEYYAECTRSANAVMVPFGHSCAPLMCVVTTCDVREGDELLISYGHSYWIRKELKGALSADEGAEMSKKAATPAVVDALFAMMAPAVRAQAEVEADYAPEISRLEQVFAAAAREAAFEKREAERQAKEAADFEAQKKANEVAVPGVRSRDARSWYA